MATPTDARPDVLLVNPSSGDGTGADADELAAAATDLGVRVVMLDDDIELADMAREQALGASSLGMAGGDGSLGPVAAAAMAAGIPFVCIPFGTRNHFALDLGLDREDPVAALDAFAGRAERAVDVALVDDRVVMNNLAFGVYAEVVHSEAYRDAKVTESTRVTREMLRGDRQPDHLIVEAPDGTRHEDPFALLVANNSYGSDAPLSAFGRRERLDGGVVQVSVADADSGWDLAALAWALATGGADDHDSFIRWTADEVVLRSDQDTVQAGLDGEAVTLAAPITVRSAPGALRMLVPAGAVVVERRGLLRSLFDANGADDAG